MTPAGAAAARGMAPPIQQTTWRGPREDSFARKVLQHRKTKGATGTARLDDSVGRFPFPILRGRPGHS